MKAASNPFHHAYPKKVPFRERAFAVGNFIDCAGGLLLIDLHPG